MEVDAQIDGPAATENPALIKAQMNELYQSNYVNGRDISNMFALYRKVQVNVLGVSPQDGRYVDAEEPSTPTLQRFSRINQSTRFTGPPLAAPGTLTPPERPHRKILKFEPCGSPIDEMSGEEDRNGNIPRIIEKPRNPDKFVFPEIPPDQWEPEEKFPPPPEHVLLDYAADTNSLPWNLKYSEREKRRNQLRQNGRPRELHIVRDDNWVLRERLPALEASVINRSGVTVTSPNKPTNRHMSGMYKQFIELHKSPIFYGSADGLNRDRFMTYGRLRLFKTNSTGRHSSSSDECGSDYSSWGKNSTVRLSNGGSSVSSRSSSNSVPDDPLQRSMNQVNSRIHVCDVFNQDKDIKDFGLQNSMSDNWILATPEPSDSRTDEGFSPTDSQISSLPTPDGIPEILISRADTLSIESSSNGAISIEKILKTNADIIRSQTNQKQRPQDDTTSLNNNLGSLQQFERSGSGIGRFSSCPDLNKEGISGGKTDDPPRSGERNSRMRKYSGASAGRAATRRPAWQEKPLKRWELDEIMEWLQHIGLNDVASLLVGYEITGEDVKQWDAETMSNLGISPTAQSTILSELRNLRRIHSRCSSRRTSPVRSLFPLLSSYGSTGQRSASTAEDQLPALCHQVLALTIPALPNLKAAGFTIAEGQSGGLVVTRVVNEEALVSKGDCIIEINGHSALNMAAVDFNCLLSTTSPNRLVLIRESHTNSTTTNTLCQLQEFPTPSPSQGTAGSSNRTSISSYPDIEVPYPTDLSPGATSSLSNGSYDENHRSLFHHSSDQATEQTVGALVPQNTGSRADSMTPTHITFGKGDLPTIRESRPMQSSMELVLGKNNDIQKTTPRADDFGVMHF